MSLGKMTELIDIISTEPVRDSEGFVTNGDAILVSVRAYKEDRHGSERWANRATFSQATALFRFRKIPGITITTDLIIVCADGRYSIVSVENIKMYVGVLAEKVIASG